MAAAVGAVGTCRLGDDAVAPALLRGGAYPGRRGGSSSTDPRSLDYRILPSTMTVSPGRPSPRSPRSDFSSHAASAPLTVGYEEDPEAWNAFVLSRPEATVAHLWEWSAAIADTYGHQTHHLVVRDEAGIGGVLPLTAVESRLFGRSLVSRPYLDAGGILARSDAAWSMLSTAATELAARLRIRRLDLRQATPPRLALAARADKVTLVLDLAPTPSGVADVSTSAHVEAVWHGIGAKTRNQVRKAERAGLVVERAGADRVGDFYRVWCVNMRDLGSPAHSERWFQAVCAHLGERATCYLVRRGARVIGGLIAITFRDTVAVPWASSDRRYLSLCPNNLLYWTAICDAVHAGRRSFDFGRSSIGSGTYRFKRQWGPTEVRLYWQELDVRRHVVPVEVLAPGETPADLPAPRPARSRRQAEWVWRRLPVPLATWLGARIRGGITL